MLRRSLQILLALVTLFLIFFAPSAIILAEQGHEEESQDHPLITHFDPKGFAPGRVMSINGGPFYRQDGIYGSRLIFSNDEEPVYFESSSRLIFVPTIDTACGEHPLYIETTVDVNGRAETTKSELHRVWLECASLKWEGPAPQIKKFETSGHVTAKLEPIYVTGIDITPYGPQDGLPNTVVHYTMGQITGMEELTYIEFGKVSFKLNVDHCGTYTIELRNYYRDVKTYSASGRKKVEVTNNCDGIPPITGRYTLALNDVPQQAEIGKSYSIQVEVGYNGAFPVDVNLEFSLDGTQTASHPITVQPGQTNTYNFDLQFPASGSHQLAVKIGESSASALVEVSGTASPNDVPAIGTNMDTQLRQYDTDGDCMISNDELFAMMDLWADGTLDEAVYYAALDAWNAERNICPRAAGVKSELRIQNQRQALVFSASSNTTAIEVAIYDTNGRVVHSANTNNNRLAWNLRDTLNRAVGIGVYFARVSQTLSNGAVEYSLKKIVVMR